MTRLADNAIVFNGSCTLTLKCVRRIDQGNPKRERLYTFPLSFEGVGAGGAEQLIDEMQEQAKKAVNKVRAWEGRAAKS